MRSTIPLTISLPRQRVLELLSDPEYRFTALPMRLLAPLMRGAFRKQTLARMEDFRTFAVATGRVSPRSACPG